MQKTNLRVSGKNIFKCNSRLVETENLLACNLDDFLNSLTANPIRKCDCAIMTVRALYSTRSIMQIYTAPGVAHREVWQPAAGNSRKLLIPGCVQCRCDPRPEPMIRKFGRPAAKQRWRKNEVGRLMKFELLFNNGDARVQSWWTEHVSSLFIGF